MPIGEPVILASEGVEALKKMLEREEILKIINGYPVGDIPSRRAEFKELERKREELIRLETVFYDIKLKYEQLKEEVEKMQNEYDEQTEIYLKQKKLIKKRK